MIAKAGLGVIGLGAISIGGVAFTKPEWLGINREVPWTPLSKDHSFASNTTDYGTTTFGSKYKGVLTGVVGTKSGENTNEDWWNKSFEQLKDDSRKNQVSDKFKYDSDDSKSKVSSGTSAPSGKGLNQICNEAYKKESSKITTEGTGDDNYKESDVWKYCSPLGEKLKTISDSDSSIYTTSGWIGQDSTNNKKLVSVTGNDKFWEIRDKEFRGIGKYQKIEEAKDDFFDLGKNKTIKKLCEEAYTKTAETSKSTKDAPTSAQAIKYCSINKE